MRILLANHHLRDRAGSELYCLELGTALREAGHEVGVFTFHVGPIAREMVDRGVAVFSMTDEARLEAFAPQVVHAHHTPCLYFLAEQRISAPALFSSLGASPPLEAPPIVWEGVARGLAVSEEVRDALRKSRFGQAVPLELLRNWFDDRRLAPPAPRASVPRRIAVVTNHLDPTLRSHLDGLCARRPGIEWIHLGAPANSVPIDARVLEPFELVITIGRTALLAGALGKPCLLYDVHGSDGLLDPERLPRLASRNFSGRLEGRRPGLEELEHLVFEEAPRARVAEVAEQLWAGYRLTGRVAALEELYTRVQGEGVALGEASRPAYGRAGRVHAEASDTIRQLREQIDHQHHELQALQGRHEALLRERDGLDREVRRLSGELQRAQEEQQSLQEALAAERSEVARQREHGNRLAGERAHLANELRETRSYLGTIEESLAWRGISRLRRVKDTVLPKGGRRRRLYDRALSVLKGR